MSTGPAHVTGSSVCALDQVRERLWGALLDFDEYAAAATVFAALDDGVPPETVLLDVVGVTQRRVGLEWAANHLTVAQEHAATAINDRVIAAVAHHPASRIEATGPRIVVACVDGEWHVLPARLVAEVLRLRGFRVDFLGAQVPTPHLITHLHQHNPAVVALSASIPIRLPAAHAAISACQAVGVPVLAGGPAFGTDGRFARRLGADGWAADAPGAAECLTGGLVRPDPNTARQAVDDLPHLHDQEYTMVARSASALVRAILAGPGDTDAASGGPPAEDLAQLVQFLAAALYIDDGTLFTGFVEWTTEILAARSSTPPSLSPALGSLAEQLGDFPRAIRMISQAQEALSRPPTAPGTP